MDGNPLLGRWQALPGGTGGWTPYSKIAFTKARMYVEDQNGRLLRFKVKQFHVAKNSVSARTAFGETYAFERVSANVICFERPRIQALEESRADGETGVRNRRCYRRV